ncbi:MAG: toprim domain-containing protein [Nitrospirota bacterium]|nr:toprim domain-containing protein [Nitrospirota bacterium]
MYDIKDIVDDHIYPHLDRRALLAPVQPEDLGHAFRVACPKCGARKALISKEGRYIRCREEGGCGHVEGIWSFAQKSRGLSHTETLLYLAGLADFVVTHPGPYDFSRLFAAQKKAHLLEAFLTWAEDRLQEAPEALDYLVNKRGFTPETIHEVKLGYYPSRDAAVAYLTEKGYGRDAIEEAGLLTHGLGDTHKLVAGYRDRVGRLTGIACRYLGSPPPETPKYIFSHGTDKTTPYNLHKARDFLEVIIVEGIFDVLSLRIRDIDTVIGVEDARLTADQVALLSACGIRKVILGFDRDEHGREATRNALDILLTHEGLRSYVLEIPEGYVHPDEFIEDEGVDAYWDRMKNAERGVIWRVNDLLAAHDLNTDIGREGAFRDGMVIEETLRDPADGQAFRERLAKALDMPLERLLVTLRSDRDVQMRRELERGYADLLEEGGRLLEAGRLTTLREHLQDGMYTLRSREMVRRIRYFNHHDFLARAKEVPVAEVDLGMPGLANVLRVRRGELVVVGARGRHGKSTFAYNLFLNMVERHSDLPSLFFAYEIPEHIAIARLATIWAHKHRGTRLGYRPDVVDHYATGEFPKEAFEAMNGLGQYGLEKRFSFVYRPGSTVDQLVSYAQRAADERGGLSAVFVDYLGLVRTARLVDDELRIAEVMSKLRQLAQELSAPVFVFTLLHGAATAERPPDGSDPEAVRRELERRRPGISDFVSPRRLQMESATMLALYNAEREQDLFLGRNDETVETSPLEVFVVANREGSSGAHTLQFDMKSGWIYDSGKG